MLVWCGGLAAARAQELAPAEAELAPVASTPAAAEATESNLLPPMTISVARYQARMTPLERFLINLQLRLSGKFGWPQLGAGDWCFTPERVPQAARHAVFSTKTIDSARGPTTPTLTRPESLRSSFGMRRRAAAETVRTLLDGVPANRAFDGAVPWSELPGESIARAEFVPGGGGTAWGEAPTGVLQLFTRPVAGKVVTEPSPRSEKYPDDPLPPREVVYGTGSLTAGIGSFGRRSAELVHTEPTRAGLVQLVGTDFAMDGFTAIAPEARGGVDVPTWEHHHGWALRFRRPLAGSFEATAAVKSTEVTRGLGTPDQHEQSRSQFASVALAGTTKNDFAWNSVTYVETRAGDRNFSAVDRARGTERPVLDEFAEPATAWGTSWTGAWRYTSDARTNIGADVRVVRGEARSHLGFAAGAPVREIVAGGAQQIAGLFALHQRPLAPQWRGTLGLRLDGWRETGHGDLVNRVPSVDGAEPERVSHGRQWSPTVGIVWAVARDWRLKAATQESFRRPTLAERHRWWGEHNTLIAPNAALKTERSQHAEATLEYAPRRTLAVTVRAFTTVRHDAVATQSITRAESGLAADVLPAIPETIEWRRRINLDRVTISGAELSVRREFYARFAVEAEARLQQAKMLSASDGTTLGRELPQTPRQAAWVQATWRPAKKWRFSTRVRWLGRQYIDEENTRRLNATVTTDGLLNYTLNACTELFLKLQNIGDARVESDREARGVVYLDNPRGVFGGVRLAW